jgi:hypothetical protein
VAPSELRYDAETDSVVVNGYYVGMRLLLTLQHAMPSTRGWIRMIHNHGVPPVSVTAWHPDQQTCAMLDAVTGLRTPH